MRLELPLKAANSLVENRVKTSSQEVLYITRTVVRTRQKVPVRIVYVSDRCLVLAGRTTLGRCESVTWTVPMDDLEPQPERTRRLCEHLQGVLFATKPNLNDIEGQNLEQFINDFQDIFAT
jgi:hypothetical protein